MRGFLKGFITTIGGLAVLILSVVAGVEASDFGAGIAVLLAGIAALFGLVKLVNEIGRYNMSPWLQNQASCQFKYGWDGSGIAVDTANQIVKLFNHRGGISTEKSYPYADIRAWGFVMEGATTVSGSQVFGGGIQGASHNIGSGIGEGIANAMFEEKAKENIGLWLEVKDIDNPKWFVKFKARKSKDKNTEIELRRWMEILQQHINRDRPAVS
jgi:hypothetical protein